MASAFAVLLILTFVLQASTCDGVRLPNYIPTLQEHPAGRDDLIESYFHLGLEYTEILFLVVSHDINLSLRQLKRILKAKGLGRRRNASDLREVVQAVEEKLRGSGSNVGYGQMTQRLVNDPCIVVAKETVRELLKILDPEGYHKLKPSDFCIHGAIDGFSRRILWLQRNEAWWSILGKDCTKWWIDFFKDTRSCGLRHDNDSIEVECLKYCFMPILRDELHRAARLWNLHRIRPSTNMESPSGRPDVLFFLPEVSGTRNCMVDVDLDELELVEGRCCYRPSQSGCSDEFTQLAEIIMREKSLQFPRTPEEATTL
ncbi:uncharacterized protein LOC111324984 [Stylophora pistillata]|uniref:uncharacterized protein LOC111324984 n=1 Tax=Stylophora pistillata TaxID=50429 RepID=UPI000C04E475|nr:uncharacterized protein LOC111324984 [Stylophora pistillata]